MSKSDFVYDPDKCPSCGGSGYAVIREAEGARRAARDAARARRYFVYRAYDEAGVLLYVGMTSHPRERWYQHKRNSSWAQYAARFRMTGPFLRDAAKAREREAIRAEHPLWNINGRTTGTVRPEAERYIAHRHTPAVLHP